MNLYNLTSEYLTLYNELLQSADEETGEVNVDVAEHLNAVGQAFEQKAIATACVYRMLMSESEKVDRELDRLKGYKDRLKRQTERIKSALATACTQTGYESIRDTYVSISFRSSEQTIIDNEDELPAEYVKVKTEYQPNKTEIKAAIKAGKEVPGAHIEKVRNIQIK